MLELKQIFFQTFILIIIVLAMFSMLSKLSDFVRKYKSMKRKLRRYERILKGEQYENKNYYKNNNNKS